MHLVDINIKIFLGPYTSMIGQEKCVSVKKYWAQSNLFMVTNNIIKSNTDIIDIQYLYKYLKCIFVFILTMWFHTSLSSTDQI